MVNDGNYGVIYQQKMYVLMLIGLILLFGLRINNYQCFSFVNRFYCEFKIGNVYYRITKNEDLENWDSEQTKYIFIPF